ncbi:WD repeat domain phosphoinositide-interacting protein 2 [Galemys pyrenaicus]|uniref:WD repeat domain phosphoinositide-interacting protein 2 n=1 Tax=Galemys pyrenaicus TaxID=202257 RepID=A0A8J6DNX0_GALPY|nr:WD repeat domain phosphoinositide-interacting protein 2 [Galemys pyrenaicus]
MNLVKESGETGASHLLFATFNQDYADKKDARKPAEAGQLSTHQTLLVGTKSGYKIFGLSNVDKLEQIYESTATEDVCIVESAFSSSLVALVSLRAPQKLTVFHTKRATELCSYLYSRRILAVKMNRQRLVVCLEDSLYIYNTGDQGLMHVIRETPPNPAGLCALSENNYLAFPGSTTGEVHVFDSFNLGAAGRVLAHRSSLAALALDARGTMLATASERGTIIRVFSVPEGQSLFEFRRGIKRCVDIYSLAFSTDSAFLCSSSNTETVHIFKLQTEKDKRLTTPNTWAGYLGSMLGAPTGYWPSMVTDIFSLTRAFATVHLPVCGLRNVCSLATIQKVPQVLVGTSDGCLYIYNLDPREGGECTLKEQHRFDGDP